MSDAGLGIYDTRRWLIPFRSQLLPQIFTDTLIIGSGVAGLQCALESVSHGDVLIATKDDPALSSTAWAQGGIAAAVGDGDDPAQHLRDTIEAGAGLVDPVAAERLVRDGLREVERLLEEGFRVDRDDSGGVHLGREGGHHHSRILHTDGAATGIALVRHMLDRVKAQRGIRLWSRCHVVDVVTEREGDGMVVRGALTWHPKFGLQLVWARAVVVASGGAGQVFRETTNPRTATGDGLAIAWRAGAALADLEFTQFHPTTLYVAGGARHLLSEALRGEGARLVLKDGSPLMARRHPMGDLAPRDIVSRAILDALAQSGESHVFLDARHLGAERFRARFPGIAQVLAGFGLDGGRDLLPIHPAAHYTIGGIWTDGDGRSTVRGLFAAGEAASTGVHGANRLASNSLLEGLVFGRRCALAAAADRLPDSASVLVEAHVQSTGRAGLDLDDVRSSLRSAMWRHVGVVREGTHLVDVRDMFDFWGRYALDAVFEDPTGWETQNLLTVGRLMVEAASVRHQSVGTHYRRDAPVGGTVGPRSRRARGGDFEVCPLDLVAP
ncbi:MAG: L-aspartate oxidase [Planctomycetota bacterium]|nr:L-aspartate oxidase [Planctomycetota bacterium]MDA1106422.1 L-aspartate oxidase [Planctomycetota bacterium]